MHGLWSIENLRRKRGTEMHDAPDWGGGEEFIAWVLGYGYAAGHYKAPEASQPCDEASECPSENKREAA